MKPFRRSLKTGLLLAPVVDVLGLADGTLDAAGLDQAHLWRHEQRALELLGDTGAPGRPWPRRSRGRPRAQLGLHDERVHAAAGLHDDMVMGRDLLDAVSTSSICEGNTLVPRMMSMSSERERTLSIRASVRPQAQGSVCTAVRSWVR